MEFKFDRFPGEDSCARNNAFAGEEGLKMFLSGEL